VNSTAIVCLHAQGKLRLDGVVFADTGGEHPETYEHLRIMEEFCRGIDLPFHVVSAGDLYTEYFEKQIIPFRAFRSCTDKFKIRPIKKFAKANYVGEVAFILGIDYGERHRAERYMGQGYEFPLIEMGIDREGCKEIIRDSGLEVPIKSGCFYCPFTKKDGWLNLLKKHRELFLKAEEFEQNCRRYPSQTLTAKPLKQIRESIELQNSLCNWLDQDGEPCVFCHD